MTLPASGPLSITDIQTELGIAPGTQSSLNDAAFRSLAGVPAGAISFSDFYGKSAWNYSRPSSHVVTGSTATNPAYAYDTTSTAIDNSTCAVIQHGVAGVYPVQVTVTYSGFGTGIHSGTLYIAASGSTQDSAATAMGEIGISVNGSAVSGFPVISSGTTPVTFSNLGGSAIAVPLTNQDLSTLTVEIYAIGGHVGDIIDNDTCNSTVSVYDIVFKP